MGKITNLYQYVNNNLKAKYYSFKAVYL